MSQFPVAFRLPAAEVGPRRGGGSAPFPLAPSPNRLCGIPHKRMYVTRASMLSSTSAGHVFAAKSDIRALVRST